VHGRWGSCMGHGMGAATTSLQPPYLLPPAPQTHTATLYAMVMVEPTISAASIRGEVAAAAFMPREPASERRTSGSRMQLAQYNSEPRFQ
jgi:hypothetical protein